MFASLSSYFTAAGPVSEVAAEQQGPRAVTAALQSDGQTLFAELLNTGADRLVTEHRLRGEFLPPGGNDLPLPGVAIAVDSTNPGNAPKFASESTGGQPSALLHDADPYLDFPGAGLISIEGGDLPLPATPRGEIGATIPSTGLIDLELSSEANTGEKRVRLREQPISAEIVATLQRTTPPASDVTGALRAAPNTPRRREAVAAIPTVAAPVATSGVAQELSELIPRPAESVLPTSSRADKRLPQLAPLQAASSPQASPLSHTLAQPTHELVPGRTDLRGELIATPVRDVAWSEKLGDRVLMMAGKGLKTAEIRLTPAELGPLRIQLSVDDGATSVTFYAQHAVTRESIEQAMPRLREMMTDSGLTLGQADVAEQGVAGGKEDRQSTASPSSAPPESTGDDSGRDDAPVRQESVTSHALVDTFA